MGPLTKKYLDFCFLHCLEQIFISPTMTTDKTEAFIDHVLTNSSLNVSKSGVTDVRTSSDLIFCTTKTLKPKYHKLKHILVRSLEHYTKENIEEDSFSRVFKQTCVNAAYLWYDAEVISAIKRNLNLKKS